MLEYVLSCAHAYYHIPALQSVHHTSYMIIYSSRWETVSRSCLLPLIALAPLHLLTKHGASIT
jgi:hypothetical protein